MMQFRATASALLKVLLLGLLGLWSTRTAHAESYIYRGRAVPLRSDPDKLAIKLRLGATREAIASANGGTLPKELYANHGIFSVDAADLDDSTIQFYESLEDVEYTSRVYLGRHDKAFVMPPRLIVRFRPGTSPDEIKSFFSQFGLTPREEFPEKSGRFLVEVQNHKQRSIPDVSNTAYFDDAVEYVTPSFISAPDFGGDCFDTSFVPPGCTLPWLGPQDAGCTCPAIPTCICPPAPACGCTRYATFPRPQPPWNPLELDQYAAALHQFEYTHVWDAWNWAANVASPPWTSPRGSSAVRIFINDGGIDRDHLDLKDQVDYWFNTAFFFTTWAALPYSKTLHVIPQTPGYIYLYFIEKPIDVISGTTVKIYLDNLHIEKKVGANWTTVKFYNFEIDASDFQALGNHSFERTNATAFPPEGAFSLKAMATGKGDATQNHIRINSLGLQANTEYRVSTEWTGRASEADNPAPLEALVRFGIAGDAAVNTKYGENLGDLGTEFGGGATQTVSVAGVSAHGTTVAMIAAAADNADNYGTTGVAPGCKLISAPWNSSDTYVLMNGAIVASRLGMDVMNHRGDL